MPATIKHGSSGTDVSNWQNFLNAEGAKPQLDPDGSFGPMTETATKAWQAAHGLDADGVVGPKTWALYMPKQTAHAATQAAAAIAAAPKAVKPAAKLPPMGPPPPPEPSTHVAKAVAAVKKAVPAPVQQAVAAAHEHITTTAKGAPVWLKISGGVAAFIGTVAGIKTLMHKKL